MAEPTSVTGAGGAALVAIAVSLVGVRYGPVVTVGTAALVGAFVSLGEVVTAGGRLAAARYLAVYTLAACVTSGSISYLIDLYAHIPAAEILALVAFCIGWIGGRWTKVLEALLAGLQKIVGRTPAE